MSLLEPREVSGRSARSPFRPEYTKLKSFQVAKDVHALSWVLERTC